MFVPSMAIIIKYARSKIIVKLLYTIHLGKQLGPTLRAGLAHTVAKHLESVPARSFPFTVVDLGVTCVKESSEEEMSNVIDRQVNLHVLLGQSVTGGTTSH